MLKDIGIFVIIGFILLAIIGSYIVNAVVPLPMNNTHTPILSIFGSIVNFFNNLIQAVSNIFSHTTNTYTTSLATTISSTVPTTTINTTSVHTASSSSPYLTPQQLQSIYGNGVYTGGFNESFLNMLKNAGAIGGSNFWSLTSNAQAAYTVSYLNGTNNTLLFGIEEIVVETPQASIQFTTFAVEANTHSVEINTTNGWNLGSVGNLQYLTTNDTGSPYLHAFLIQKGNFLIQLTCSGINCTKQNLNKTLQSINLSITGQTTSITSTVPTTTIAVNNQTHLTAQQAEQIVINDVKTTSPNANITIISVSNSTIQKGSYNVVLSVVYNATKPCPTLSIEEFDYPALSLVPNINNLYTKTCVIYGLSDAPSYVIISPEIAIVRSYTQNNKLISSYVNSYGYNNTYVRAKFYSYLNQSFQNVWIINYTAKNANHSAYVVLSSSGTVIYNYTS